jgi:hypothetical protein
MWLFTTVGETWGLKETIPTSLSDAGQLLQLASLIEAKHFQELLNTNLVVFGMYLDWYPGCDSNAQPARFGSFVRGQVRTI